MNVTGGTQKNSQRLNSKQVQHFVFGPCIKIMFIASKFKEMSFQGVQIETFALENPRHPSKKSKRCFQLIISIPDLKIQ